MRIRFRSTDGLRRYGRDRAPKRCGWYARALAKMDREKAAKAKETCPMIEGAPCFDPELLAQNGDIFNAARGRIDE
jgi:hypothetical protein